MPLWDADPIVSESRPAWADDPIADEPENSPAWMSDPVAEDAPKTAPSMNSVRAAGERSTDLFGNLLKAGSLSLEAAAENPSATKGALSALPVIGPVASLLPNKMVSAGAKAAAKPIEQAGQSLTNIDLGYVPTHTWETVKREFGDGGALSGSAWAEVGKYAFEQGVKSIPDMVAAVTALPAYITSRSVEIGEERAKNKGKPKAELTDALEALPFAIGSALLERIGAKGISTDVVESVGKEALQHGFKAVAKQTAKEAGKGLAKEGGTEFIQEGIIEYAAERFGTDAAMSVAEGFERGVAGAVAGGAFGGGVAGGTALVTETLKRRKTPEERDAEAIRNITSAPDIDSAIDAATQSLDTATLEDLEPEADLEQQLANQFPETTSPIPTSIESVKPEALDISQYEVASGGTDPELKRLLDAEELARQEHRKANEAFQDLAEQSPDAIRDENNPVVRRYDETRAAWKEAEKASEQWAKNKASKASTPADSIYKSEQAQIQPSAPVPNVEVTDTLPGNVDNFTENRRMDPVRGDRGARRQFQTPEVFLEQRHREKIAETMAEAGLTQQQAEAVNKKFAPKVDTDKTTGYYEKRNLEPAIERAQQHAAETGEQAFYAEVDLANMGGGNKAKGGSLVKFDREFYTPMATMLRQEVEATGGDVIPVRAGGDELGFIVVNTTQEALDAALKSAAEKTAQMARDQGMGDIENPKYAGSPERGINLYFGITPIVQGETAEQIREVADSKVGKNKVERNENVGRIQTQAAGAVAPEGQTAGTESGVSAPDRRIRPAGSAAPEQEAADSNNRGQGLDDNRNRPVSGKNSRGPESLGGNAVPAGRSTTGPDENDQANATAAKGQVNKQRDNQKISGKTGERKDGSRAVSGKADAPEAGSGKADDRLAGAAKQAAGEIDEQRDSAIPERNVRADKRDQQTGVPAGTAPAKRVLQAPAGPRQSGDRAADSPAADDLLADLDSGNESETPDKGVSSLRKPKGPPRFFSAKQASDRGYISSVSEIDEFNKHIKSMHGQGREFDGENISELREITKENTNEQKQEAPDAEVSEVGEARKVDNKSDKVVNKKGKVDKDKPQYSKQSIATGPRGPGLSIASAQKVIDEFRESLNGPDVEYVIVKTQDEAFGDQSREAGRIKGAYHNGRIVLVAENLNGRSDALRVLRHETLAHFGLNTLPAEAKAEIIQKIIDARDSLKKHWTSADQNYPEASEQVKAEEVFAHIAEDVPSQFSKVWNEIVRIIQAALKKMGLIDDTVTTAELRSLVESIAEGIRRGGRQRTPDVQPAFSKTKAPSDDGVSVSGQTTTKAFRDWFKNSAVVDESGNPKAMYRGDYRDPGAQFRSIPESEGGSGAIYFTDNPEIASGYAKGKPYMEGNFDDVLNNTTVILKSGRKKPLNRVSISLTESDKKKIENAILTVGERDSDTGVNADDPSIGRQTWNERLSRHRSDYVKAANDVLLESGLMSREEFVQFLEDVGIFNRVFFDDPAAPQSVVTPVYLSIQNPLDINNLDKHKAQEILNLLPEDDITAFSIRESMNGNPTTVTAVTDNAKQVLTDLGYDGIRDLGGRNTGSDGHDVFLAFEPTQIKSAISNRTFDPSDPNIMFSKTVPSEFSEENRRLREENKTIWNRAKKYYRRNFMPGGLLPKDVFAEKIKRDSEVQVVEFDINHLVGSLENIVKSEYGAPFDKLDRQTILKLNRAMVGKIDPDIKPRTLEAIVAMRQYIDSLSREYVSILEKQRAELTEDGSELAQARADLIETITSNIGTYAHRSYRAFDDKDWYKKIPDSVLNGARKFLIDQYVENGETKEEAARLAEVTLHEMTKNGTAYSSMDAFIRESKLGAKDLTVLKKRKQIAPEIRALLGEYIDPRVNFAKSATKMGRLVWNQRFLDRLREAGMGAFLFEGKSRPPEATVQIAGDGSDVYAPLNGLWTYPEIDQAFKDALAKEKMSDWYRVIVQLNGLVKYGKTVLSPTTAARNWQSAMFFALANGHFNMKHMAKSIGGLKEYFTSGGDPARMEYLRKLKKLGVVYDTPYAGEMMRLLEESKIEDMMKSKASAPYKAFRSINKYATKAYQYGDDFWKIIGFENEKAALIDAGMKEAEAEKEAAERIRNTYPTYSMVGKAINWLRRFPLAGTFVSFPAEIIRTQGNILRYIHKDWTEGRKKLALRRITGQAIAASTIYSLAAISKAMFGIDDEEEEAVRLMAAPWERNSNLLFTGRDENGQLQYIDLSFLDPYNYFKRPITAILRDQPWEDAAADVFVETLKPFLGTDIAAGAIGEALYNKKDTGQPVYNEFGTPIEKTIQISNHLRKALQPGIAANIERTWKAIEGEKSSSGRAHDLGDEAFGWVGWRFRTLEPKTALYYRSFEFADAKVESTKTLSKVLRDPNEVSDEEIKSAYQSAKRQQAEAYREMSLIVQAAKKNGLDDKEIRAVLKSSNLSDKDVRLLLKGKVPPLELSKQSLNNATKKAKAIFDKETADEIRRRYRAANQMSRQEE